MNMPCLHSPNDAIAYHRPRVYLESPPSDVTPEVVECFGIVHAVCSTVILGSPTGAESHNHCLRPSETGIHSGILVLRYGFQG